LDVAALAVVVGIDMWSGIVDSRRGNVGMIFVVVEGGNNIDYVCNKGYLSCQRHSEIATGLVSY
jgi:predicted nucleic acid-binding Zn finger protein